MKKLSFVFAFVILFFTAQAQSKSDLVGKWVFDIDSTSATNTNAEFENLSETEKKEIREVLNTVTMEFRKGGTLSINFGIANSEDGTYTLEGKLLTLITEKGASTVTIKSINDEVLIIDDDSKKEVSVFKKTK